MALENKREYDSCRGVKKLVGVASLAMRRFTFKLEQIPALSEPQVHVMFVYSTTPRLRNPVNRNHLGICLSSSLENRN